MEHKCLITRALKSAGRGRLSRNTSVVGGLWISPPLFSCFIAFLDLFCSSGGPVDPLLVVWRGFLPHGSLQTDQLSKTTVHFIKTLSCVCPPYRLPTQTTRSGQGHRGVYALSLSVRSSHAPSFLSCGVVRELAEDSVCGGISVNPPSSHVFCLPTAPLQIPLLRLFLPLWSSRSLPPHQQPVNKPPPGVGAWSWPCVVTHCPLWDPYHWQMRHGCVYVSYMGDSSSAMCGLVLCWLRRSYWIEWWNNSEIVHIMASASQKPISVTSYLSLKFPHRICTHFLCWCVKICRRLQNSFKRVISWLIKF